MSFNSPFTGNVIQPTDVSYSYISIANTTLQLEWPINGTVSGDAAARFTFAAPLLISLREYPGAAVGRRVRRKLSSRRQ